MNTWSDSLAKGGGVSAQHREFILTTIRQFLPEVEVLVFGSRIDGTSRKYSDLDIALKCESKIDPVHFDQVNEALSESEIPYRIDFSIFSNLSDEFKEVVLKKAERW